MPIWPYLNDHIAWMYGIITTVVAMAISMERWIFYVSFYMYGIITTVVAMAISIERDEFSTSRSIYLSPVGAWCKWVVFLSMCSLGFSSYGHIFPFYQRIVNSSECSINCSCNCLALPVYIFVRFFWCFSFKAWNIIGCGRSKGWLFFEVLLN